MRTLVCFYLVLIFQVYMTVYISFFAFSKCAIAYLLIANVVAGSAIRQLIEALYSEPRENIRNNHRYIWYCSKLVFTITLCCASDSG